MQVDIEIDATRNLARPGEAGQTSKACSTQVGCAVAGVLARKIRTAVSAKPTWQQSMLRIKAPWPLSEKLVGMRLVLRPCREDPEKSLDFYKNKMGMRLLDLHAELSRNLQVGESYS